MGDQKTLGIEAITILHQQYSEADIATINWEVAVQWGLLCAFGVNLDEAGRQTGEIAARVLQGEDVKAIKAEYPRKVSASLNRKTADVMGILSDEAGAMEERHGRVT